MLTQKKNPKTNKTEYCLVSVKTPGKVLEWYGPKKPSDARVEKSEKRVTYFDNKGKR
jgi:hypothetical protein